MKDRFSSEEWNDLLILPFHLFTAVALADGEIQKSGAEGVPGSERVGILRAL